MANLNFNNSKIILMTLALIELKSAPDSLMSWSCLGSNAVKNQVEEIKGKLSKDINRINIYELNMCQCHQCHQCPLTTVSMATDFRPIEQSFGTFRDGYH